MPGAERPAQHDGLQRGVQHGGLAARHLRAGSVMHDHRILVTNILFILLSRTTHRRAAMLDVDSDGDNMHNHHILTINSE